MPRNELSSQGAAEFRGKSPIRLRLALGIDARVSTKDLRVTGQEHIERLRPGTKVVVATSHITDMDVPFAAHGLSKKLDLAITEMSIHRDLSYAIKSGDPSILGTLIAGRKNFLTVSYPTADRGSLLREDLQGIGAALDRGKAVVIAAHNRPAVGQINQELPDAPGYLAVLAAYLSGAVVLPVAVQIGSPTDTYGTDTPGNWGNLIRNRPHVQVSIGAPLQFDAPRGIDTATTLGDILRLSRASRQRDAGTVMQSLANLLPVERKGKWGDLDSH